jgi:hypothetical protein
MLELHQSSLAPHRPCKYAIKGGHISDAVIESLVPKIHASFGGKIARVLALPLLWAAFEGETTVNEYTLPIIPHQRASDIKDRWVGSRNSPGVNPIEKISLAIQQLSDQLVIGPIHHPAPPAIETGVDGVDAVEGEIDGDVDVGVQRERGGADHQCRVRGVLGKQVIHGN